MVICATGVVIVNASFGGVFVDTAVVENEAYVKKHYHLRALSSKAGFLMPEW